MCAGGLGWKTGNLGWRDERRGEESSGGTRKAGQGPRVASLGTWLSVLAWPPPPSVTLGMSIALLVPQYPHLYKARAQLAEPGPLLAWCSVVTQVGFTIQCRLELLLVFEGEKETCWLSRRRARVGHSCVRQPKATREPSSRRRGPASLVPGPRAQSRQQSQAGGKFPLAFCPGTLGGQEPGVQGTHRQPAPQGAAEGPAQLPDPIAPRCPDAKILFCSGGQTQGRSNGDTHGCCLKSWSFSEMAALSQSGCASPSQHQAERPWDTDSRLGAAAD